MKQTTIQVPYDLLAQIRIYCVTYGIKTGDFVQIVCKRDTHFQKFTRRSKRLTL